MFWLTKMAEPGVFYPIFEILTFSTGCVKLFSATKPTIA
jgi:hypothetical protein